jgi:AraC-like DNA-binding protein
MEVFSTAELPASQRVARWEDHNRHALIGLRCHLLGDAPFDGTEVNRQLDRMHLARVRGSSHVVERPAAVIRRDPADAIAVYLTLVGEAFFYHDDGVLTLHPGQALICDADRPFVRGFSHGLEELAVKVPRPVFREATGLDALPAPLVRDVAHGDVAARTFARLVERGLRPGSEAVDEAAVLQLLAALAGRTPADPGAVYRANARAFIADHLADPGLTAARIAAGVGISERHLSRTFAAAGTSVPRYVLARRLERARTLLVSERAAAVAEVAARCGFGSASYFSQAFRAHFGVRPADVRR